jgi:thiosulfate dehydrogenase [quinone] large subunit
MKQATGAGAGMALASVLAACASPTAPGSAGGGRTRGVDFTLDLRQSPGAALQASGRAARVDANGEKLIVIRVSPTEVVALSSVCTHRGCEVNLPSGGQIACGCHGSRYNAATGAVLAGPAIFPLRNFPARIEADAIIITM